MDADAASGPKSAASASLAGSVGEKSSAAALRSKPSACPSSGSSSLTVRPGSSRRSRQAFSISVRLSRRNAARPSAFRRAASFARSSAKIAVKKPSIPPSSAIQRPPEAFRPPPPDHGRPPTPALRPDRPRVAVEAPQGQARPSPSGPDGRRRNADRATLRLRGRPRQPPRTRECHTSSVVVPRPRRNRRDRPADLRERRSHLYRACAGASTHRESTRRDEDAKFEACKSAALSAGRHERSCSGLRL